MDLADAYAEIWDVDIAARDLFLPGEKRDTSKGRYVASEWFHFREIERLPEADRKFAAGLVPFAGMFFSHAALQAFLDHAPVEDVISELRVGTAVRKAGLKITPFPASLKRAIRWDPHPYMPVSDGFFHPIKPAVMRPQVSTCSVLVVIGRDDQTLSAQLRSIGAQTKLPDELVVVDDGATDAAKEVLREFSQQAPFPIRLVVHQKRRGYVKSIKEAVALAEGDALFFCDRGDVWDPEKIEASVCFMRDGNHEVVTHDWSDVGDGARVSRSHFDHLAQHGLRVPAALHGGAMVVRRSFFSTWGWPGKRYGIAPRLWVALMSSLVGGRGYLHRTLVARHRLPAGLRGLDLILQRAGDAGATLTGASDVDLVLWSGLSVDDVRMPRELHRKLLAASESMLEPERYLNAAQAVRQHADRLDEQVMAERGPLYAAYRRLERVMRG
ncbi:MAG: glycosyltransferase [Aquabacterium sp.]|uniref:glycosyltransferase n=1 Tax=Aquabacterium sp. TaxID=1872578 RepID=UPI003BCBF292